MVAVLLLAAAALLFFRSSPAADDAPAASDEAASESPGDDVPSEPPDDDSPTESPDDPYGNLESLEPYVPDPPATLPPTEDYDLPFTADDVETVVLYRQIGPRRSRRKEVTRQEDIARIMALVDNIQLFSGDVDPWSGGAAGGGSTYFSFRCGDGSVFNCMVSDWRSEPRTSTFADGTTRAEAVYVDQAALWEELDYPEQEGHASDEINTGELSLFPPEVLESYNIPYIPPDEYDEDYSFPLRADEIQSVVLYSSKLGPFKEVGDAAGVARVVSLLGDAQAIPKASGLNMSAKDYLYFRLKDGTAMVGSLLQNDRGSYFTELPGQDASLKREPDLLQTLWDGTDGEEQIPTREEIIEFTGQNLSTG